MSKEAAKFFRLQAAAIAGSLLDYLVTISLVEFFSVWYMTATVTGNLLGGTVQFLLNRKWVFRNADGKIKPQILKFSLVFAGNIILGAAGTYLLTNYLMINYLISKTLVSLLLGLTYNYILQKKFVFA